MSGILGEKNLAINFNPPLRRAWEPVWKHNSRNQSFWEMTNTNTNTAAINHFEKWKTQVEIFLSDVIIRMLAMRRGLFHELDVFGSFTILLSNRNQTSHSPVLSLSLETRGDATQFQPKNIFFFPQHCPPPLLLGGTCFSREYWLTIKWWFWCDCKWCWFRCCC